MSRNAFTHFKNCMVFRGKNHPASLERHEGSVAPVGSQTVGR